MSLSYQFTIYVVFFFIFFNVTWVVCFLRARKGDNVHDCEEHEERRVDEIRTA